MPEIAQQVTVLPVENNDLMDPYESIIQDMELDPSDAAWMAAFVDPKNIVEAMKGIEYDVKEKIRVLGVALKSGTISQQMSAMKMLDGMVENSLASRGIIMKPGAGPLGTTDPLGLPQALHSVEMVEKSCKVTLANTAELADVKDEAQPLKEPTDGKETEDPIDDAFYEDTRGTNSNIFRPPQEGIGAA